jgi:hypothetical protein
MAIEQKKSIFEPSNTQKLTLKQFLLRLRFSSLPFLSLDTDTDRFVYVSLFYFSVFRRKRKESKKDGKCISISGAFVKKMMK